MDQPPRLDPLGTYFAPSGSPAGGWELWLSPEWSTYLEKELRKAGARHVTITDQGRALREAQFTPGEAPEQWTVPVAAVPAVNDLLLREGLRGSEPEFTVDEVLSYLTPNEVRICHSVPARILWLLSLPDATYADLLHRAERRARPEVAEAVAQLTPDQLRVMFRAVPALATMARDRGLHARSPVVVLTGLVREYVDDPDHLADLLAEYTEEHKGESEPISADILTTLGQLQKADLVAMAQLAFPARSRAIITATTKPQLIRDLAAGYDRLPSAATAILAERLMVHRATQAEKAERKQTREQKRAEEKAVRVAEYERNRDLYPLLPELLGQEVPVYADVVIIEAATGRTYQKDDVMGMGRITAIGLWLPRSMKRGEQPWEFKVQYDRPLPDGLFVPIPEGTYTDHGMGSRLHPGLRFSKGVTGIDLRPALADLLRARYRTAAASLEAVLYPALVRYLQARI